MSQADRPRTPFRTFETVIALVHRGAISRGDHGEVSRVFPDGRIEVETKERVPGMSHMPYLPIYDRPPFSRLRREVFAANEVRRPHEYEQDIRPNAR
jgi:hypothetical protein